MLDSSLLWNIGVIIKLLDFFPFVSEAWLPRRTQTVFSKHQNLVTILQPGHSQPYLAALWFKPGCASNYQTQPYLPATFEVSPTAFLFLATLRTGHSSSYKTGQQSSAKLEQSPAKFKSHIPFELPATAPLTGSVPNSSKPGTNPVEFPTSHR
ncbi:unnamed protein product [Prunus armeniaca]|uniref:Uncharacterized protein n=1 Tax=Prunus armeniaca TaxID=36596 RepID=A0A6J5TQ95_PRUAR|nr:unnamed protein product [Prunus armeniaca]